MQLSEQLEIDEGKRKSAYQDSLGYWTIGIGRLIDARLGGGLSEDEIQYLLRNDIARAQADCKILFPAFGTFSQSRRDALTNLMFNLGREKLSKFVNTVAAINRGDWTAAREGLRNSLWYKQVGVRADRIIKALGVS